MSNNLNEQTVTQHIELLDGTLDIIKDRMTTTIEVVKTKLNNK